MRVRVEAFAIARERLGFSERAMDCPSGITVSELLELLCKDYPQANEVLSRSRCALDGEYVSESCPITEGAVLSIIPPVSGGAARVEITEGAIGIDEVAERVSSSRSGAVILFVGTVRNENSGAEVVAIEYEAKRDMAVRELERLIDQAIERWGIHEAAIVHRVGRVLAGEASVVIAVAAGHRKEAYDANAWLLAELKRVAPIWKHEERRINGRTEKVWIGTGGG